MNAVPAVLLILATLYKCQGNTVKVVSILEAPYLTESDDGGYEGFIQDLLHRVCDIIGVSPEIYLVPDGKYGSKNRDGTWNGMIGEIVQQKADIAAAALTITSVRERVVDYTGPFMSSGITLLVKKPSRAPLPIFYWLSHSFSLEVWCVIGIAFGGVLLLLYLLTVFVPVTPCDDSSKVKQHLGICGTFFRTLLICAPGSQFGQSRAVRILRWTWYLFAGLTAILYITSLQGAYRSHSAGRPLPPPISSVDDLVNSNLQYGYVESGSTEAFFKYSKVALYERVYEAVSRRKMAVKTIEEGIQTVREGGFVLIGESPTLNYIASKKPCNVMTVGGLLNMVGYGLVTPLGSKYRDSLRLALLEMRESGVLAKLQKKHWFDRGECGKPPSSDEAQAKRGPVWHQVALRTYWTYGAPALLMCGAILAVVVGGMEILIHKRAQKNESNVETPSDKEPANAEKA